MGTDEEAAFAALSERRGIIDATILERGGRIFGSAGDSVVAEFQSSVEATRCAVQIQEQLCKLNKDLPDAEQMNFRIGINFGDVIAQDGDLLGDGVNVAARIEGLAPAGGVCISGQVAEQISGKVDAAFVATGRHKLKNMDKPVEIWCWPPESARALRRSTARGWKVALGGLAAVVAVALVYVFLSPDKTVSLPTGPRIAALDSAETERRAIENGRSQTGTALQTAELEEQRAEQKRRVAELRELAVKQEQANKLAAEIAYWNSVKDSRNSKLLQSYLKRFPNGMYVTLASHLIEQAQSQSQQSEQIAAIPSEEITARNSKAGVSGLTRKLQRALAKAGCGPGHVDGEWGRRSQNALERFAKYAKLTLPDEPVSRATLRLLERHQGRVCPVSCGRRYVVRNGRCIVRRVETPKAQRRAVRPKRRSPQKPEQKKRRRVVPYGGVGTNCSTWQIGFIGCD
ncbi:MAG: adenylate/guanylate cyclase domain-containing protein [Hyphomicrobiales bacterium]